MQSGTTGGAQVLEVRDCMHTVFICFVLERLIVEEASSILELELGRLS
jgi:hypothetical protein